MYLVAILDWYSRYVVSWQLDQTLDIDFVLDTVDDGAGAGQTARFGTVTRAAISPARSTPNGCWRRRADQHGWQGACLGQHLHERLWRTVKYEEVYLHDYVTPKDAFQGLTSYFHFYNQQRLHQAIGYRTPAAVYRAC